MNLVRHEAVRGARGGLAGVRRVEAVVSEFGSRRFQFDEVVVERPLEIRIAGEPVTLTMRTPGEDGQLTVGFLYSEGIIRNRDDVGSVAHCGRTNEPRYGDVIDVLPGPGVSLDPDALAKARRTTPTHSSCGLCGRGSVEDLLERLVKVDCREGIPERLLAEMPELLARGQVNFARTGGLHAAAAVDARGEVVACAEDIGRHNAVDKVVGKLLYRGLLPRTSGSRSQGAGCLLAVSGRASFEMVQKAAAAGFPCLASVSAASSLAIETADALGVTLASFVRQGRFTLYTHPERIA